MLSHFSCVWLFVTPWTAACHASLSFTISKHLLKFMFTELMMPSNHLSICNPLLILPSNYPSIVSFSLSQFFTSGGQRRVKLAPFSSCPQTFTASGAFLMSRVLNSRWAKYWSFSFSPSNECPGLISFRIDRFDLKNSQDSSPISQFKSINSSVQSLLYCPALSLS